MRSYLFPALCILALLPVACSRNENPSEAPALPETIQNQTLDISLQALPEGWKLLQNEGSDFRFAPAQSDGEVRIESASAELGSNLVEAVHAHQADIESRDGGDYLGARELSGPLGTAFYSRGRFLDEQGTEMEETVVYTLHPRHQGIIALRYDYPAGTREDSGKRVQSLMDLFAGIG